MNQRAAPRRGRKGGGTIGELLAEYLISLETRVREKTLHRYKQVARLYVTPTIGKTKLDSVTPEIGDAWLSRLAQDGRSPHVLRQARALLKTMFRWAVRRRRID